MCCIKLEKTYKTALLYKTRLQIIRYDEVGITNKDLTIQLYYLNKKKIREK